LQKIVIITSVPGANRTTFTLTSCLKESFIDCYLNYPTTLIFTYNYNYNAGVVCSEKMANFPHKIWSYLVILLDTITSILLEFITLVFKKKIPQKIGQNCYHNIGP
jgi:hypothetical protein